MEKIYRTFKISCLEFGGYSCKLCVNDIESLQEIIDQIINGLRNEFVKLGLETFIKRIDDYRHLYHIHDVTVMDILIDDQEYYICNSCNYSKPRNAFYTEQEFLEFEANAGNES